MLYRKIVEALFMKSINITQARQSLYQLVKSTVQSHEPTQIVSKEGDVVMISAQDWQAIEETIYLNNVPGLIDSIRAGERETKSTLIDLDDLSW